MQWLGTKGQKAATLPTVWMNKTIWTGTWFHKAAWCFHMVRDTRLIELLVSRVLGVPRLKGSRNIVLPIRDGPPSLVDSTAQIPDLCHIQPSTSNHVRGKSAGCEGCEGCEVVHRTIWGHRKLGRVILNPKNPSVGTEEIPGLLQTRISWIAAPYILDDPSTWQIEQNIH
jgi:hypothetical protein